MSNINDDEVEQGTTNYDEESRAGISKEISEVARSSAKKHPQVTFESILSQIAKYLDETPEEERTHRNRKIMLVLQKKFAALLDDKATMDEEKRQIVMGVAEKIAAWMESIITETETWESLSAMLLEGASTGDGVIDTIAEDADAEAAAAAEEEQRRLEASKSDVYEVVEGKGSSYNVENVKNRKEDLRNMPFGPGPSTGNVQDWAKFVVRAMNTADDWSAWISTTVAKAEEKAQKKKGNVTTSDGNVAKLTREEWSEFQQSLRDEAVKFRVKNKDIQETSVRWTRNKEVAKVLVALPGTPANTPTEFSGVVSEEEPVVVPGKAANLNTEPDS